MVNQPAMDHVWRRPVRKHGGLDRAAAERRKAIVDAYLSGLSIRAVADQFRADPSTVRKYVVDAGHGIRGRGGQPGNTNARKGRK
jgi:transposase-like protein